MGEVYRARDTKLGREVAIKILPELLIGDSDLVARFEREAHLLASLNHPNIAIIHGLEDSTGVKALVMELIEGLTLAEKLADPGLRGRGSGPSRGADASGPKPEAGALPLDEALTIARQIADALEAAHEKGIVHRDLKPANVKVTSAGQVKVLDFGLAKLAEPTGPDLQIGQDPNTQSSTLSARATRAGMILGTAAYMSPEQARGGPVDRRTDIWSFGCVLFEMLTGQRAFEAGDTISDSIASILTKEPGWRSLPTTTPPQIRTLLARCLQKDARKRLPHIGVAKLEIDEVLTMPPAEVGLEVRPGSKTGRYNRAVAAALLIGAAMSLAIVLPLWAPWRAVTSPALLRLEVGLGADASLVTTGGAAAILSPDGQTLAFVARRSNGASQLYVRRLNQLQATPLPGTDGAFNPFFSPDGRWIAFFDGKLKKIAVTGGAAVPLCDGGLSGTWGENGTIVFSPSFIGPLSSVSSGGGPPEPLTTLGEGELTQRWPQLLPGGRAVLYTSSTTAVSMDNANLVVKSLPNGTPKIIQRRATYGRYLPSGHLLYVQGATLFAAPFDGTQLEIVGPALPVLEGVTVDSRGVAETAGGAQFSWANTGTLAYQTGGLVDVNTVPIVVMDRTGRMSPLRNVPADWSNPKFSPDGSRLAMDINNGGNLDVWVYDWTRDTLTRLTSNPADDVSPIWTPDARRLALISTRENATPHLYWQRADGTGDVQRLTHSTNTQLRASWHPSGKFLAFDQDNPQTGFDLMILPMEGNEATGWTPGKPTVFLNSPSREWFPSFSPDGRWLAYVSNESGRDEVYVQPFPGPGSKWQISTAGVTTNDQVKWSRVRSELFFLSADKHIMVASYAVDGDLFRADKPRLWSDRPLLLRPRGNHFDLHPDGERVAMAPVSEQLAAKQDKVVLVFNFFDELRRLAPTQR